MANGTFFAKEVSGPAKASNYEYEKGINKVFSEKEKAKDSGSRAQKKSRKLRNSTSLHLFAGPTRKFALGAAIWAEAARRALTAHVENLDILRDGVDLLEGGGEDRALERLVANEHQGFRAGFPRGSLSVAYVKPGIKGHRPSEIEIIQTDFHGTT